MRMTCSNARTSGSRPRSRRFAARRSRRHNGGFNADPGQTGRAAGHGGIGVRRWGGDHDCAAAARAGFDGRSHAGVGTGVSRRVHDAHRSALVAREIRGGADRGSPDRARPVMPPETYLWIAVAVWVAGTTIAAVAVLTAATIDWWQERHR